MGKDWYWAGRSSKKGGGTATTAEEAAETQATPSGCMCAVFHFFDFHPFHFRTTINHQQQPQQNTFNKSPSCIPEDITTVLRGAEAPRNSLESGDGTASSVIKEEEEEEDFKIPKNIQIKTSGGSTRTSAGNLNDLSSDSPATAKTPTLVARLMGLDLLPDSNSPSSSSSSCLSTPNPQGNVSNLPHHMGRKQHIQTKHRNSTDCVDIASTRFLPETSRISSARRSDVDYHHWLSLQINKENNIGEDLEMLPRFSFSKRKYDENNNVSSRSSSHLARKIVKQVKESVVSRKVGQDITNTLKIREQESEERVSQFKFKKISKATLKSLDESSPGKHHANASSYSPRLRFMDTKNNNKPTTPPSPLTPKEQNTHPAMIKFPPPPPQPLVNTQPQLPRVLTRPKAQALLPEEKELQNQKSISVTICKKVNKEKFSSRLKRPPQTTDIIRNKQEEPFIVRPTSPPTRASDIKNATKSKKTHPLSSNLLNNINTVPNLFPIKTDPSPPATKFNQKQSQVRDTQCQGYSSQQLSSCSSQRYKQEGMSTLATREISSSKKSNSNDNIQDKPNDAYSSATGEEGAEQRHRPEFQYITGIVSRTTNKDVATTTASTSTVSLGQWFSPTHPLDPSIFHHLEEPPISNSHVSTPNNIKDCIFSMKNQLGHRWNRRLMFDLVDEVLMEILWPKNNEKRLWFLHGRCCYQGIVEGLMEKVWKRIGKFPRKRCEFLEDIDGLIEEEDMEKVKVEGEEGLEEEGEGLVEEIEGNIWDTLVHESVMLML